MDVLILFREEAGAAAKQLKLKCVNDNFLAALIATSYGFNDPELDSLVEMSILDKKTKLWVKRTPHNLRETYLKRLRVNEETGLRSGDCAIIHDDDVFYYRNCTDKFYQGLKWMFENVVDDFEYETLTLK